MASILSHIYKNRYIIKVSVIFALVTEMSLFSQSYSDFLGEIQSYQDKVAIKSLDEKDIIDPETFDAETYFEFFENIQFSKNRIYGVHY